MRAWLVTSLVSTLACRPEIAPPPPQEQVVAEPRAKERARVGEDDGCRPLVEPDVVAEAYARGVSKLDESRDGEHYAVAPFEAGIGSLKVAAQNGSLEAQSLYGRTLFGVRFTNQAPTPDEREDYTSAVAFLRIAAKAGDEDAQAYLPGLTTDASAPLEPPLDSLPEGWVQEAFGRADAWIECYGLRGEGG